MAMEINIPKLGLTMEEATLAEWVAAPGQAVAVDETVLILETDKVSHELAAPGAGLVHPVVAAKTVVTVGQTVGYLAADRAELDRLVNEHPAAAVAPEKDAVPEPKTPEAPATPAASAKGDRTKASPLARAMAREHGLDLTALAGSGPGGRIVRADILKALEAGPPAPEKPAAHAPRGFLTAAEEIPIRGVRKVVFQNMHQSLQTQAQLTLHTEASADRLVEVRNQINETGTLKIGYNTVFIKAVACALKRHPHINASVTGDVITVWKEIHIGLAVDVGKGLIVPKIRDAGNKTLHEIQTDINAALEAARSGALMPDDLKEGTFTVTNLGAWEIDDFTPIVNPPESAILGIGRMIEKPVVRDGRLMVGKTVALSLTIDHRIIDGAPGAAFLKTIKEMIENPIKML